MTNVFLSLGSNQGNRIGYLKKSILELELRIGKVVSISSYFETEPWGFNSKTLFINQVICINTILNPSKLLEEILIIERQMGRNRKLASQFYTDRCIDIDILLYGDEIIEYNDLIVPHKFLHERRFVLEPLNQVAHDLIHPIFNKSINDLLLNCNDKTIVKEYFEESVLIEKI